MGPRSFDSVLLVVNPRSGGGRAGAWVDRVAGAFRSAGVSVDALVTGKAGDAGGAAAGAPAGAVIVAFGGDGTVNEALNGADLRRNALAVIPAGTGNVLAKELRMSRRPLEAVGQLLRGRVVPVDVGECNGRRFVCCFGAGIDAQIIKTVHERRGRTLTKLHYVPHVTRALFPPTRWDMTVEVDGRPLGSGMDQVTIGNTHSYGGPLEMTSMAELGSGTLDVMCARLDNLMDVLSLTMTGFLRAMHRFPRTEYGKGTRVRISSSRKAVPYEVDGESAGVLPADITVHPGAARLLVPRRYCPLRRSDSHHKSTATGPEL